MTSEKPGAMADNVTDGCQGFKRKNTQKGEDRNLLDQPLPKTVTLHRSLWKRLWSGGGGGKVECERASKQRMIQSYLQGKEKS